MALARSRARETTCRPTSAQLPYVPLPQQATAQSDWDAAAALLEDARTLFRRCGRGSDEVIVLAYLGWVALRQEEPDARRGARRGGSGACA